MALVNGQNDVAGSLTVSDVFPWDKPRYVRGVYGTERFDHPGGRMVERDPRTPQLRAKSQIPMPQ